MNLPANQLIEIYRKMVTIRLFEEKIIDLYARGLVPGLAHLYVGEEAIAVGVCANLRDEDYITSTHRGHGHVIAKGAELKYMMAELFGKKDRILQGQGRLHAHRRRGDWYSRCEWNRGRRASDCHRRRSFCQDEKDRSGDRLLLRRRVEQSTGLSTRA